MLYSSLISEADWKYPQAAPNNSGLLEVSAVPQHRIYWEEYGNPTGEPVMFIHGGPGGASSPAYARFFNPARYRIILFDQRGCGKSLPHASNSQEALLHNTTPQLIDDIIKLREHCDIHGKMHVFGGSWGSTLALAYAIAHPATVASLVLRGIFLLRKKELDYFYQGNAALYAENPQDTSLAGAYLFFPEAWRNFVEIIPPPHRHDMIKAYAEIFAGAPSDLQTEAAIAWSVWEGATSYLAQDLNDLGKFAEPDFAKAFARIENHYFMNGGFLGGKSDRHQNYILQNAHLLQNIPIHIVHGRYDQVCPLYSAYDLIQALHHSGNFPNLYLTAAGHSMMDLENHRALTHIMDTLPPAF